MTLYQALLQLAPSLGARLGWVAALAKAEGTARALREMDQLEPPPGCQPYWALKAHLLWESGDREGAMEAGKAAADLSSDPAVMAKLREQYGVPDGGLV